MINLYSQEITKLENLMLSLDQKKYRATQLYIWLYEKRVDDFDKMSDISLKFREVLKEKFTLTLPTIDIKQVASDGTIKLLLKLEI